MKFADLQPFLARSDLSRGGLNTVLDLNFNCPGCGTRTIIHVSHLEPEAPVWKMTPDPRLGKEDQWLEVTIFPSIKDTPHPRNITCAMRHYSVIGGEVKPE